MITPMHVAITRRVRQGCEGAFEEAIRPFFSDSLSDTDISQINSH